MPHNRLQLQGGVIENETPVINQAGIATSNRIRFRPDNQGLSLPEKLGGWAKFFSTTITNGVVRALWGWQDTADNQWIGFGTDNATGAQLGAIQCTLSGSTGLTTATGSIQNLLPDIFTINTPVFVQSVAGSNVYVVGDNQITPAQPPTAIWSVDFTVPISVGGVILQGIYPIVLNSGISNHYEITANDILGNPLNALYTSVTWGAFPITSATFTTGFITFNFTGPYTVIPGQAVNISDSLNIVNGTYIVSSSTSTSFTVPTTLGSYTLAGTVEWGSTGDTPLYSTNSGDSSVTVTFANHGNSVGDPFYATTPTLVGGIVLQGEYTIVSVPNAWTFTFLAASAATATSTQYMGAIPITGGTATGTHITYDYSQTPFSPGGFQYLFTGASLSMFPRDLLVQGVNPSTWNGWFQQSTTGTHTSTTVSSTATAGSWVSGGSLSPIGGLSAVIYSEGLGTTATTPAGFWTLDSWGNDLIAVSGNSPIITYPTLTIPYQPIYYWDSTTAPPAQIMVNGPQASTGAFVAMPQRQIVAWGTTFSGIIDPLLIRWCDVNNFNTWVDQTTNQAGSFRLASGAAIIGARQVNQQGLIWTDIELWAMQYISTPLVYGFNKIGVGCGLIGKYAHGVLGGLTYWMSKSQFWMLSGEGTVAIPCPIWDVVFQDLDLVNADKITCATNAMFQEITWYFPVKSGTGENSNYIKLNVSGLVAGQPPLWDFGALDRSAWIDVSVLQQPIGFSPVNHLIYQHEISPDADGAAMGETFTTGWFALAEGDVMPFVDQVWPDFKWGYFGQAQGANINLTISGADYPGLAVQSVGPYTVTQSTTWISPRMRHRLLSFTVAGTGTGTWWRLGGIRYRYQADGRF